MTSINRVGDTPTDLTSDLEALEAIQEDHAKGGVQDEDTAHTPQSEPSKDAPSQDANTGGDDVVPPWKQMFSAFGMTGDEEDDDEDAPRQRGKMGDISPLGTYEDFIADHWIPGETTMEVAIFRGEPETMKGHQDARFDTCFHVTGDSVDSDTLVERLRTEYGGGVFRLRFYEEKPGRQPFTSTKKTLVITVEEDPIFKARLGKYLSKVEDKRLETQRIMQREKYEYSAQERMIALLEQQRREAAEEARQLRLQGQQSPMQDHLIKILTQQMADAREEARRAQEAAREEARRVQEEARRAQEEAKMTENSWLNLLREREREQGETTQRIMESTMSSQERIFEAMSSKDNGMQPMMMMFMQMQRDSEERRKEERERERERMREEAERRREEKERDRQVQMQQQQFLASIMQQQQQSSTMMMQQQQQASQQMMQIMLALNGDGKKDDTFAKIASVLASSPVVAKLLDRGDNKSEMMSILLPMMTNDKQSAEKRAQMLEERVMQVLQQKNDPKASMMELVQMMQLMKGMQTMMMPPMPVEDNKDEEEEKEDPASAVPAWLGAATDFADKFGLGRVAEAAATALLTRSSAPAQPPAPEPLRTPRTAPLAPAMPPMPQVQLPPSPVPQPQQLPPPPMVPTPPQQTPPQSQPQEAPQQPKPQAQPNQQAGKQKMDEQALFDNPPPEQAQGLFNDIEAAIAAGTDPAQFANSRNLVEKTMLKALLPKGIAAKYVRHHAKGKEKIQSIMGMQWLNELVEHIYG